MRSIIYRKQKKIFQQKLNQREFFKFAKCSVRRHFNTAFSTGRRANVFLFFFSYQVNFTKFQPISFDILKYLSKFNLVFTLKPPVCGYKYIEFRDFKNI